MALNIEFNDRNKRVSVRPGTTMFQVLEDAREQFQLDASIQYELTHRNKPIDLSLPFRLTGISNNASLELKAVGSATDIQHVRVCIQLADGKRIQGLFGNDSTLESILGHFQLVPSTDRFSLSFLRREILPEAFPTTTLKELGLVSGSAIFRVQSTGNSSTTAVLSASTPASIASPPSHHDVQSISSHTAIQSQSMPAVASSQTSMQALSSTVPSEDVDMEEEKSSSRTVSFTLDEPATQPVVLLGSYDSLQLLRDSNFDAVSRGTVLTLMKIVANVLSYPDNEKMRSIRLANPAFDRSVGQIKGGIDFLLSVGFTLNEETQHLTLQAGSNVKMLLEDGFQLLQNEADDLGIDKAKRPVVVEPKPADPNFDVFKPQITRMQMQPRGPSATEVLVETLKTKQDQILGHEKPPRNTSVILNGRTNTSRSTAVDAAISDTVEDHPMDSQLLISSMKARLAEMEKAKNFRTQAMRELDELKRKKIFQTALIRIQFPDRAVLQASFHPKEAIQDVMAHIKECLDSQFAEHKFYLYVTPPTQRLSPEKTLAEMNLVPAALTYLSWMNDPPKAENKSVGYYFRRELVDDKYTKPKDSEDSMEKIEYPKPMALVDRPASEVKAETESKVAPKSSSTDKAKSGKKPSWLKL